MIYKISTLTLSLSGFDKMGPEMASCTKTVAKEVHRESKECGLLTKETWSSNVEVQAAVRLKKESDRNLHKYRDGVGYENYSGKEGRDKDSLRG